MFGLPILYESIMDSFDGDFEMIVAGPHPILWPLCECKNIKVILTKRSPNSAQQEALCNASGDYICAASDDGIFLPGALDQAMRLMEYSDCMMVNQDRRIIVGKYLEGDNPHPDMEKEDYYKFKYHKAYRLKGVPQDQYIFNCGLISRDFLMELGGWDAECFETTTCAHADLGIRASKSGAQMILMNEILFKCSHEPKHTGTHAPIHNAMIKKDLPNFKILHSKTNNRINININNWEKTPEIWSERFK